DLPGDVANLYGPIYMLECIERHRYGDVPWPRLAQASEEQFFQHGKSLLRRAGRAKPFAEFDGRSSPEAFEIDVRVGEFDCRHAEDGGRAAWSEVHADDRCVHEWVDQEEVAVRSRDNRSRIPPTAIGMRRVVNPDLVVREVDHHLDRTARQNPLPGMRWYVRTIPEAVDVLVERRTRNISAQKHSHGPQELSNAAET